MTEDLIRLLHEGGHSLVLYKDKIHTFDGRGIADLYRMLTETPDMLKDAVLADKIVGKAAAAIMIVGSVRELYADTISTAAVDLLQTSPIKLSYGQVTEHIINRTGTGYCPMEMLCADCASAEEAVEKLKAKFATQP